MKFKPSKYHVLSANKRSSHQHQHFYNLSGVVLKSVMKARSIPMWVYPAFCHGVPISALTAICKKTNQKLGFVKRNLKCTPQELKHLAYIAVHFLGQPWKMLALYGIVMLSKTEESQRRAAHWISNKHVGTTSVTVILGLYQLHLEYLEDRRWISRLTFLYKILKEHVAIVINHLDLVLCDRPVRGPTTKQRLKIPRCASAQFKKSFAARTVTEWNSLPDSITSLAVVPSFSSQLSTIPCPQACTLHCCNIHQDFGTGNHHP